jgi:putative transposase
LKGVWVPHDTRDQIVDCVHRWSGKTGIAVFSFLVWLGLATSKWHNWKSRYGKANEHNAWIPRDHWLEEAEKTAIVQFHEHHPLEGYRRLTFMMLDADVVAASPSSVYRVLKAAGVLARHNVQPSLKGKGFAQPLRPHEHWHVDVSYLNIAGTFYYLCSILDGYSRSIVHWEIREAMTEADVQTIIQRGRERFPDVRPRVISDNGPQFIARDFKEFIRICGMTHVKTSPYYPQSNGKIERFHRTLKGDCIRTETPLCLADAQRIVARYVEYYNKVRLHSAIGYITPKDKLEGREKVIFAERDRKLEAARERRRAKRQVAREASLATPGPELTTTVT